MNKPLNFLMKDIDGNDKNLSDFSGKVVLIVNVASKCGLTPQYEGLQKLFDKFKSKGFVILGFPSNDFLKQEPGTEKEIKEFCSLNYDVSFPLFSKVKVRSGKDQSELYQYLTSEKTNPGFDGKIEWNFQKYLIDKSGKVVKKYNPKVTPEEIEPDIETYLN